MYSIGQALEFIVFEEDVDPKEPEDLVDDILCVFCLKGLAGWCFHLGPEGDEGHSASHSALVIIELGVQPKWIAMYHGIALIQI